MTDTHGILSMITDFFTGGMNTLNPRQRKDFFRETEYKLFFRGRVAMIFVAFANIAVIVYFLSNMFSPEQFIMHLVLGGFAAIFAVASFIKPPYSASELKLPHRLYVYSSIALSLIWGAVKTSVDQIAGSPVQIYLLILYVMAAFGVYHPLMSFLMFVLSFVLMTLGVSVFQTNPALAIPIYISSSMFTLIAWFFSQIILRANISDFKNRIIIEEQNKDLTSKENKLETELDLAKKLQESLLPRNIDAIFGIKFYIKYLPLIKVGGDIYDVYKLREGVIRVFLADATGHGVEAGFVTMIIKSEYEKLKSIIDNTAELTEALNINILDGYHRINLVFPAIVVDIDTLRNELRYSSAGYNNQMILRENSGILPLSATGKIIGVESAIKYTQQTVQLQQNDRILLFTDGLYEEFNRANEEFGFERLVAEIEKVRSEQTLEYIVEYLLKTVCGFIGTHPANDDITIVGISVK
ncbi:MAG: hypothetical protein A2Y33_06135 [Spirochaetes bacterium GWF1_51_8]|nr:MAG: hypothetical protein A2Y33_06135 [Spirochaetes bacterium GWF1_51_8]